MPFCDVIKQQEELASQVIGNPEEDFNFVEQFYIVKV